jgi:MiaB-like tRNA modifying enzyme
MKIYLEVYGCTANKSDASLIRGLIKESNHELTSDINEADVLILLTCTVIGTTEQRMLSRLKVFKKTGKKIIVAGCMASVQSDLIKSILPDTKLIPPQYTHNIVQILKEEKNSFSEDNKTLFTKYYEDLTAPILISEGCNFSCAYCITSLARGKLKSYPLEEITQDICSAIKQGCKEIQLTAQDTASYGLDNKNNLGDLLREVCKIEGTYRVRVGMMNPYTAMKNLNKIVEGYEESKVYKFLHLPVQSGDNDILEKMDRKYSIKDFLEIINKFREKYPDITISTDIIVGFPTETEKQFQHTIDLLEKVKPDITNITRYSARPYTKAKTMKGRVPTNLVKNRSKKLTDICRNISKDKNLEHIGKKYKILVTKKGKVNTMIGRSENYKPVVIKEKIRLGDIVPVEITDASSNYLVGNLI